MPPQTRPIRVLLFVLSGFLLVGVLLFSFRTSAPRKKTSETAASQPASLPLPMTPPAPLLRGPSAIQKAGVKISTPSETIVRRFPGAGFIEGREAMLPSGEIHRVELIETTMKYPLIRVESWWRKDPVTGQEKLIFLHEAVADHVVVELQKGKSTNDLAGPVEAVNGTIFRKVQLEYAETFLVRLPTPSLDTLPEGIAALSRFPAVIKVADPDGIIRGEAFPNDSGLNEMWSLHNTGQTSGYADCDIDMPEAWSVQTSAASVIVAVVDSGLDLVHADLTNNIWTNPAEFYRNYTDDDGNGFADDRLGWDFVEDDNYPYDLHGHGTHVAGTIGAQGNNSRGTAGVCWSCKLMAVRVLDANNVGYVSDFIAGFDYARRMGAKIVNASLTGAWSSTFHSAIDSVQSAGVLVVAAAGNNGTSNDLSPKYPASFPNANIISVASSDHADTLSSFSNYGATSVDLAAPGSSILSTVPNGYNYYNGTSMAAPHVSGVAAMLKAQNPSWTYTQIRSAILSNVDVRPQLVGKCVTGGRLNAYKTLAAKIALNTALDNSLTWSTGGNAQWVGRNRFSHDSIDVADSGTVWHNQHSWIETTVTGPGALSFWWKVSSESTYDGLDFVFDGVFQTGISGAYDWNYRSFTIGSGNHTLRWAYSKDGSDSGGDDQGWLDQVTFIPHLPATPAGLIATALSPNRVNLSWRKTSSNTTGFIVSRSTSLGGPYGTLTNVSASVTNCLDATVHSGLTYYYVIKSYNSYGSSTNSSRTIVTLPVGLSDNLVFQNSSGKFAVWVMNQTNFLRYAYITNGPAATTGWRVAGLADLNGDYNTDILWQNSNGQLMTWLMRSTNLIRSASLRTGAAANTGWKIVGTPELTGDNKADFLWRNNSGAMKYWRMNGTNYVGEYSLRTGQSAATGWNIVGTTDLDNNSKTDIIWSNTNGMTAVWWMNRTNFITNAFLRTGYTAATGWKLSVLTDLNADRKTDFVWEKNDGRLEGWLMNGSNFLRSVNLRTNSPVSSGLKLIGPK